MNTILTDDEIDALELCCATKADVREIEAAVLAKLREQEPVAWLIEYDDTGEREVRFVAGSRGNRQTPLYAAPLPAVVQVPQGIDVDGRRIAAEAENHACSLAVWMTRMDAESPDADDLGVSGWLQEAEKRIKRRMLAAAPEAPATAVVQVPQGLIEAVDRVLEEAHCDCPHRLRFDDGEHLSGCPLFDLNVARLEMLAAATEAPAQPSVPAPWREAVKVAREAMVAAKRWHQGDKWRDDCTAEQRAAWEEHAANLDAALAQLDALEGGE